MPQHSHNSNTLNGFVSKKIKTALGETNIKVSRDREASFNLILVPKSRIQTDKGYEFQSKFHWYVYDIG